jgi:hypothetical protein
MADEPTVTCCFCLCESPLGQAVEEGWEPGYYLDPSGYRKRREWVNNPVCPECAANKVAVNEADKLDLSLEDWP